MLSIQKVVLLLDEFHYQEFERYLDDNNAMLSLKLVRVIKADGWSQKESDDLCEAVYGTNDDKAKKKFFQLVHHTFKLTYYLARNFPSYLSFNVGKIHKLINVGQTKKANDIAEILIDIADKIEDFQTQIQGLKFLSQQAFILESPREAFKDHTRISELLKLEIDLNELYLYMRETLNVQSKTNITQDEIPSHLEFYSKYENSDSFAVRILSRFAKVSTLSFVGDNSFYTTKNYEELLLIEKELQNNCHVLFPFLEDVLFKVYYFKLQYQLHELDTENLLSESLKIIKSSSDLLYWKNYLNVPELFSISIQTSYYLTNNCNTYRSDYYENLDPNVKQHVNFLKDRCREMLARPIWGDGYILKLINLKSLYSGLLLMGTKDDVKEAIEILEEMLTTYQQISFQKFLDGIFGSLIVGNFSLKQYDKVAECYKRYKKLTSSTIFTEENDITINALYYASQWISNGRKQYVEKLQSTYERAVLTPKLINVQKLIIDLSDYYNIPLKTTVRKVADIEKAEVK